MPVSMLELTRLGVKDLETRLHKDRSTIWRWYQRGRFPKPHYIGDERCWFLHEVEAWEREEMARAPGSRRCSLKHAPAAVASPPAP